MKNSEFCWLYVGTYNRPLPYFERCDGKGIVICRLNLLSGKIIYVSEIENIDNPSYMALDSRKKHLYVISEIWGWEEGLVSSYAISPQTGELRYINMQPTGGSLPCYVMVEQANQYIVVSNFWSGNAILMPINEDGSLGSYCHKVQHEGSGPTPLRQESAHAHCAVIDPSNKNVLVADLGCDSVMSYHINKEKGKLELNEPFGVKLDSGSGPRHLVFHPNNKFTYVINELSSSISVYRYKAEGGILNHLQTIPMLPNDLENPSFASEIQILSSGKFLYGANREHGSISIFSIDQNTGMLTNVRNVSTQGKIPRNIALDPTEKFLLAANQESSNIVTFRIDHENGNLIPTGQNINITHPAVMKMATIPPQLHYS